MIFTCGNCGCVNPDHLIMGSQDTKFAIAKKLDKLGCIGKQQKGEKHSRAKLTSAQVKEIRELASIGIPYRIISERFGINEYHVSRLKTRRRWNTD